jgi:hypothetical protein
MSEQLEKLRKEHPPMIDLALTDITRIAHVTKLLVRTSWLSRRPRAKADSPTG